MTEKQEEEEEEEEKEEEEEISRGMTRAEPSRAVPENSTPGKFGNRQRLILWCIEFCFFYFFFVLLHHRNRCKFHS